MNLQQLRYFCAVVENRYNLTGAAETMHTSQPGVSKQIRLLERELGIDLLVRRGNRITGMTEPGKTALRIATRVLGDIRNLRVLGEEFTKENSGQFVVAATHIHERYWLTPVILQFGKRYPDVQLHILRGSPSQVMGMVVSGQAHIGISTITGEQTEGLSLLPCHDLHRCVLTPRRHPLLTKKRIRLEDIARYPLIINASIFSGGWSVLRIFEANGLKPNIVLDMPDSEVIKTCVEQNIGITVLPTQVYDPERDRNIRAIDANHLFEPMKSCVVIHQNYSLRRYASDFIQMFAPQWTRESVDEAIASHHARGAGNDARSSA